jgi:carbamoyltransferase
LEEYIEEYFGRSISSPFMLVSLSVRKERLESIVASAHVDGSARFQSVSKKENTLFWSLIEEFRKLTGVPALLNTSFNENEPIVCSPEEALDCFLRTKMDILAIGSYLIRK